MLDRATVRTVATLVAALCVVTMFAGSAAAVDLGAVDVAESEDDAVVDVNLDTEADQSGGGGSGSVDVNSDQGGAEGSGAVEGDVENQSLTVAASGEGGPADQKVGGGVECEISPDSAQNPQDACQVETPGGEEPPIPEPPAPEPPGNPLPEPPSNPLPEPPTDPLPQLPGDDLPITPGGQLPADGLQAL